MMWQGIFYQAATLGVLMTAVGLVTPAAAKDVYKIGGVMAFSGSQAYLGNEARKGVELAIADRGGKVLGVPIESIWEDSETKPQVAVQKGIRVLSEGVDVVMGATGSPETLALMGLVVARKVPMVVQNSGDPSITGDRRSRYIFRPTTNTSMDTMIAINGAKALGLKKVYGLTADYKTTRGDWEQFKTGLGGSATIVGEDFVPLGTPDFSVIINRINNSGADSVAVFLSGSDTVTFMKQAEEVKLSKKMQFVGPYYIDEGVAKAVGPGSVGAVSAPRYDYSLDIPASKEFVAKFRARYGAPPSPWAAEAYDSAKWWLRVVDQTGVWDTEKWVTAFETSVMDDGVVGKRIMRACDHQAELPGFLARVVEGTSAESPYVMKVLNTFDGKDLIGPCPK
jgi:ABC-type branched-subunit amino acid transport system substrate-binding protein